MIKVAFEGIDGSGKTTLSKEFQAMLNERGIATELRRFPDRTTRVGKIIADVLHGSLEMDPTTLQLLMNADRRLARFNSDAQVVILDRWNWSGTCYGLADGVESKFLHLLEEMLFKPEIVVYVAEDIDVCIDRVRRRAAQSVSTYGEAKVDTRYEREDFLRRVHIIYENRFSWPSVFGDTKSIVLSVRDMDGKNPRQILGGVLEEVLNFLRKEERK